MDMNIITECHLRSFRQELLEQEKSPVTVEKYLRDARAFLAFAGDRGITKELVIGYKRSLMDSGYAVGSVNTMLTSINRLFAFLGMHDCRVKNIRTQRQIYCPEEKNLTKAEYARLLDAARGNERLALLMQTICGTGIRVSELKFFTVEAVTNGEICVHCKGKIRTILIPAKLKKLLLRFARRHGIGSGPVFVTRNGNPMNRSNIWTQMKKLCERAGIKASKVFPHNLRKLFAKTFYKMEKDVAKLADILGHSNINTTRIYIMTTGAEHRSKIERLGLII